MSDPPPKPSLPSIGKELPRIQEAPQGMMNEVYRPSLPPATSLTNPQRPRNLQSGIRPIHMYDSHNQPRPSLPLPVIPPVQPPPQENVSSSSAPNARPLNVKDALSYLDQVKYQFSAQPEVYNRFLDIMKDFKSQEIDTPGVIERVSNLFRNQPKLIVGFNTFLPPGYSLEPTNNPMDPVRVTTPKDVHYQPSQASSSAPLPRPNEIPAPQNHYAPYEPQSRPVPASKPLPPVEVRPPATTASTSASTARGPVEFNHAINYVNKIKTRFAAQPEVYRLFLEILQTYQKDDRPIKDVYGQVQQLFASAPDLLEEFKQFLPDNSNAQPQTVPTKKPPKRNAPAPPPSHYYSQPPIQAPPKKKAKVIKGDKPSAAEELEFFDKCKRVIGNKTTYNEFLKILNLFSQEIIEARVLVDRVEPFLGKSPELFEWFKRFVKYDEEDIIYNIPAEKVAVDLRNCKQSGHSYRRLPNNIPRPVCSGRDDIARDVLNDDWVATLVFLSENGFTSHKKTIHEDAMFKCEEERYEFDLNIEANLSVINLLEPIAKKIQLMPPEERAEFKLLPGLGGYSATIYKRVIKKVYDNERGLEVIDALHNNPAVAVPIVLKRLKQKDEEWKRSQREWNKVWREIDVKNFAKALDHQGINFKLTDRKAILQKSLVSEIEVLQMEQKEKRSSLANRYQFDFVFKNRDMFQHVHQILLNYVETSATISTGEEEKIKSLLVDFVPKYFLFKLSDQNGTDDGSKQDETMDVDEEISVAFPVQTEASMDVDSTNADTNGNDKPAIKKRSSHSIYTNNLLYAFFRLYQMFYSRLLRMKEVSDELAGQKTRSEVKNRVALELGLRKDTGFVMTEADRFSQLLKDINLFVNNEMDSNDFEDRTRELFWTSGYVIFTVDKLVQAIVKQLQLIATDSKCLELIQIYNRDREKLTTGPRQEALYRLCAEQIIQDENIYRLEYFFGEQVMTVQLLGKEDQVSDEAISSEEKWSQYVDQFVQLSSTETTLPGRRDPFLKRSLPTHVGEEPPLNVETKSGLELKICVNTYKIFFVDNTEDYFRRKRQTSSSTLGLSDTEQSKLISQKRSLKFHEWLNSERGWKAGLTPEGIKANLAAYEKLKK